MCIKSCTLFCHTPTWHTNLNLLCSYYNVHISYRTPYIGTWKQSTNEELIKVKDNTIKSAVLKIPKSSQLTVFPKLMFILQSYNINENKQTQYPNMLHHQQKFTLLRSEIHIDYNLLFPYCFWWLCFVQAWNIINIHQYFASCISVWFFFLSLYHFPAW
jgi:hypothetical protein